MKFDKIVEILQKLRDETINVFEEHTEEKLSQEELLRGWQSLGRATDALLKVCELIREEQADTPSSSDH